MITQEIENALFDELLRHTLKVNGAQKLSDMSVRQKNEYYRDSGLLRIIIDDVKKRNNSNWLNAAPKGKHTPQPNPNEEPPF